MRPAGRFFLSVLPFDGPPTAAATRACIWS